MGWLGSVGMGIGMVLVWALIIVGIVALVRSGTGDQRRLAAAPAQTPSAEQTLADRLARGEITDAEFRERLAVLREHAPR